MIISETKSATFCIGHCCISFFLFICLLTAKTIKANTIFEPRKEFHVKTDNIAIGTKSFNLYVPVDYTADQDWPVIFRFKGRAEKYNPVFCRGGRLVTCDRGAIIIRMGYNEYDKNNMTPARFIDYVDRELRSIFEAKELISRQLRIDNDRLFISGSIAGGWLASLLLEYRAQFWAGALFFVASRHKSAELLINQDSVSAFRGKPVYFASSLPPAPHGVNHQWARLAKRLYKQRGAIVSFEIYEDEGGPCSPLLKD